MFQAAQEEESTSLCKICNKHFNSKNAEENHLKSKKHKEAKAKHEAKLNSEQERLRAKQAEKGLIESSLDTAKNNLKNLSVKESVSKGGAKGSKVEEEDDDDMDCESVESCDGDALGLEECLFCSNISKTLEKNLDHMTTSHSFFIPDVEYLADLEGLITYLGELKLHWESSVLCHIVPCHPNIPSSLSLDHICG